MSTPAEIKLLHDDIEAAILAHEDRKHAHLSEAERETAVVQGAMLADISLAVIGIMADLFGSIETVASRERAINAFVRRLRGDIEKRAAAYEEARP